MPKITGPLRAVIKRQLLETPGTAGVAIADTLECGHVFWRNVSNSGAYTDYNPAARRRCAACPPQ